MKGPRLVAVAERVVVKDKVGPVSSGQIPDTAVPPLPLSEGDSFLWVLSQSFCPPGAVVKTEQQSTWQADQMGTGDGGWGIRMPDC